MPAGCEDRFRLSWDSNIKGKHHYGEDLTSMHVTRHCDDTCCLFNFTVVYGIQAAINDAYKNKADLEGSTLYTTLYPSNRCAQAIREAGILEVVYVSDKFRNFEFMKASKEIMDGIKCRCVT